MHSPVSLKLGEDKATLVATEEVLSGTLEEKTPSTITVKVLGTLKPQEEVAELESCNDKEGLNNVPIEELKKIETRSITREIIRPKGLLF